MSGDYSPLVWHDPVPGDPGEVKDLARRFADTAHEIVAAAHKLKSIAADDDSWKSHAADVFRTKSHGLSDKIGKAEERYVAAAGALERWADEMSRAQGKARQAASDARQADSDRNNAQNQLALLPAVGTPSDEADRDRHKAQAQDAEGRFGAAKKRFDDAVSEYDAGATSAHDDIKRVADHDSEHDSFWDRVGGWIHDHAQIIKLVLKWVGRIAVVLAVVAFAVGLFIPGLNVLDAALLALTLTSLAGHTALALTGDGNWLDVGLDVFALATFGAGKLLGKAVGEGATAARSAAVDAAQQYARVSLEQTPAAIVLRLLGRGGEVESAQAQLANQVEGVVTHLKGEGSFLDSLAWGDREAADTIATLRMLEQNVPHTQTLVDAVQATRHAQVWASALAYGGDAVGEATGVAAELSTRWQEFSDRFVWRFGHPAWS